MSKPPPANVGVPRVFLSYGHDTYLSVAVRVKQDLEQRGFPVWFDRERLRAGMDWERTIEDGLNWVAHNTETGRFLLLMTPHSVRRPDGFCLKELARALERGIPVIPVMLTTCEPPLSLAHLQCLDLRLSVPQLQRSLSAKKKPESDTGLDRYRSDLEQLCRALRTGMVHLTRCTRG